VTVGRVTGVLACLLVLAAVPLSAQEIIVAIQVHGNTLTPDAEIVRASGLSAGTLFSESVLSDAEARLRAFKRVYQVDVLQRYASITDPSQVLVVIRTGPVRIESGHTGRARTVAHGCAPAAVQHDGVPP
jgi:cell division septal protein FtsQ